MRRNRLGLLLMTCAGSLLVSACASRIDPGPSIATVSRDRPDESKLAIRQSERVEANQELAIENYRKILELAPDGDNDGVAWVQSSASLTATWTGAADPVPEPAI